MMRSEKDLTVARTGLGILEMVRMEFVKISQEYQKLLPPLSHSEYEALKASIKENGLYSPIIVNTEGVILDGYHRHRACVELGIEPKYEVREFGNPLYEKAFVIEANLHRRHLNGFQKVELSLPLLKIVKEIARQHMIAGTPVSNETEVGRSTNVVAKKIGVSRATYDRAKAIIERGSDELKESVRKGKTSIAYGYKMVKRAEEPPRTFVKRKFDVWNIANIDLEKPFGDPDYPGAIPGDIVGNVLMWFLPNGGKVVDPMAGGGVTEDVCHALGDKYEVLLYDNKSLEGYEYRQSTKFHDIRGGTLPREAHDADLVFTDPPYGPLKEYGFSPDELYPLLRGLAFASHGALKPNGLVAVLMQNYYVDGECLGEFVPLIRQTAEIFEAIGFKQIFEATVPLCGKVARSEDHMTHIDRRLMVFQKCCMHAEDRCSTR